MAVYSISDLEKLTGIRTHTIRMWEKRYGLIEPARTPTNIRYYDDNDLRFLMNIVLLNKNGFKISKIAAMSEKQIEKEVQKITASKGKSKDNMIDAITLAMIDLDEVKFNRIVDKSIEDKGMEATTRELLFPLLDKIGVLWIAGSIKPAHENFITMMIRQKLIGAIDRIAPETYASNEKFIIYMPEGEKQELSFLFIHYLLLSRGFRVINLGPNISIPDVQDAYRVHRPDFIFTMINEPQTKIELTSYLRELEMTFGKSTILLSGYQAVVQNYECPDNVIILSSMNHLLDFLDSPKKKIISDLELSAARVENKS
jgi:MerR family transcriptional regulator, light-induced transcriptional regulator